MKNVFKAKFIINFYARVLFSIILVFYELSLAANYSLLTSLF